MLEIRITAPEITEALNNFTKTLHELVELHATSKKAVEAPAYVEAPVPEEEEIPVATPAVPVVPTASAVPTAPAVPTVPAVPTTPAPTAQTYTLDAIAKAGSALVDAGRIAEVTALLAKYGVDILTALDPSKYGEFATDLRALGAQI